MFSIAGVYYHYFYMLFTFNSKQLGADNEGLFGFYSEEVKNCLLYTSPSPRD